MGIKSSDFRAISYFQINPLSSIQPPKSQGTSVYTGDQDPDEGISNLPDNSGSDIREGDRCDSDYQEFPLDDETSTRVFASLVEPNCYAGSRRVSDPDLGASDACLYYQLDFFQPGGGCRENYARVQFQGRETCRWAELGANQVAWYTLRKERGGTPPEGEWKFGAGRYRGDTAPALSVRVNASPGRRSARQGGRAGGRRISGITESGRRPDRKPETVSGFVRCLVSRRTPIGVRAVRVVVRRPGFRRAGLRIGGFADVVSAR